MFSIPIVHAWSERQKEVAGKGLKGTYIRGVEWPAQPANSWKPDPVDGKKVIMERVDQHINFNWIEKAPPIPSAFSVIWNGYVYIPKDGAWTFAVECDDGGALYINKRLVVNNWGFHAPQLKQGRISLKEGYHPITILYYNKQFGALMRLKWSPPGQHMETIPSKFLFVTNPDNVIEKKIEPQSKR
jgi:hypothetical protein